MTPECYDDLCSTICSFQQIVRRRLHDHPGSQVIPAIMNSDVVENLFSSQRSRCHGANTNPTVLMYSKAINTIILTTGTTSKKSNAYTNAGVGGAMPYKLLAKKTFRQQGG